MTRSSAFPDVLFDGSEVERRARVEQYVRKQAGGLLGLPQSEIDPAEPLNGLGFDSIRAIDLQGRISRELRVSVPLELFLGGGSVADVATWCLQRLDPAAALPASRPLTPDREHRHDPFPLTDVQQAYWIGRGPELELGGVACQAYFEFDVQHLDLDRFGEAWRRLTIHHEMLRAVVLPDGTQRILLHPPAWRLERRDLRHLAAEEVDAALETLRETLSHRVLPPDRGALFDVSATVLPADRLRLHLTFDLLIADAYSIQLLLRDAMTLYQDPEATLPPVEISFRDCVVGGSAAPAGSREAAAEYWRRRLETLPGAPALPLARSPGSVERPRFKRRMRTLGQPHWAALQRAAAQRGLTASNVLLCAYADVLATWSRSQRFLVNVTLFNRPQGHPDIANVVGDFTSINLLEVDRGGEPTSFEDRARKLQRQLLADLDHRSFGGVEVLRELGHRSGSASLRSPVVFTSTLGALKQEAQGTTLLDLLGQPTFSVSQTPQVWLDHQVFELGGRLFLTWDSVEALFPPGMLDDMFEAYVALLTGLVQHEKAWSAVGGSPLPASQLEARRRANETAAPVPEGLLHHGIERQAAKTPAALAVISPERSLTYAELMARAGVVARSLIEAGVTPGSLVAVAMERGWEQVVAVLGILQASAAYLPVDPTFPGERIDYLLDKGEVRVALTQTRIDGQISWPAATRRLCVDALPAQPGGPPPLVRASADDLAYVIFTSGSTGKPKGVMISHRGALNTVCDINERFGVGPHDRVLSVSALGFDLSVWDLFGVLGAGGAVVLLDPAEANDPAHWAELLARHRVTIWNSVPALLQLLAEYASGRPERIGGSLRLALLSGDWIPVSLPDRIRSLVPGLRVTSLGGATEASIWSIFHEVDAVPPDWTSIPYGKPLRNQSFHVLDEAFEAVPTWVPGVLFIGGEGVARGYLGDPDRTAEAFVVHPRTGERLYRTGDVGRYLPDGSIEFLGRADLQVKVNGYRIELGEIEAALAEHPAVRAAICGAVGDPRGARRLVACVQPRVAAPPEAELRAFLQQKLPSYMVPSRIHLVPALPLTANGKVDRSVVEKVTLGAATTAEPVDDALMSRISEILSRVLQLQVGPDQDVFSLGATSRDMAQVAAELETALQVRPRLSQLFAAPTARAMAVLFRRQAVPAQDEGEREEGLI